MRWLVCAIGALLAGCDITACGKGCARSPCPEGMVYIPAGSFNMGRDNNEEYSDEKPVHKVALSAYCMDRTEVTLDA